MVATAEATDRHTDWLTGGRITARSRNRQLPRCERALLLVESVDRYRWHLHIAQYWSPADNCDCVRLFVCLFVCLFLRLSTCTAERLRRSGHMDQVTTTWTCSSTRHSRRSVISSFPIYSRRASAAARLDLSCWWNFIQLITASVDFRFPGGWNDETARQSAVNVLSQPLVPLPNQCSYSYY